MNDPMRDALLQIATMPSTALVDNLEEFEQSLLQRCMKLAEEALTTKGSYNHLNPEESGYFDALTLAIAHWPKDRACKATLSDLQLCTHYHSGDPCYYAYVHSLWDELNAKEYGHAT